MTPGTAEVREDVCNRHQGIEEAKMSKLGDELVQSMAQALAHAKRKKSGVRTHKVAVSPDDIRNARKQLGLSQDQFADAFGVGAPTLRKWEQGQRAPTGAAKTLLKIIEREPRAVVRALKAG
jgi:putative transcriptional regulator